MTQRRGPGGGIGLAQVQAGHPGWLCCAGPPGTCYALHLAALQASFPPPGNTIYALRASDPAGLLCQLRATQPATSRSRRHPHPGPTRGPGDQLTRDVGAVGLLSAPPGPRALTDLLQAISDLTAHAAWLIDNSGSGSGQPASGQPASIDELCAVSQLAALGAELNQRGYLIHLTITPPVCLTIGHPQARRPQRIYAEGEFLCWGDDRVPMCERWTSTTAEAAAEVQVLTALAIAYEHEAATHWQESP